MVVGNFLFHSSHGIRGEDHYSLALQASSDALCAKSEKADTVRFLGRRED